MPSNNMNKNYIPFLETSNNVITGTELTEDREGLESILQMMSAALETEDYLNTTLIFENSSGEEISRIEVFEDEEGRACFSVGDRSPHYLESKGSFNVASLRNDLRAEFKGQGEQELIFNCGLISDALTYEDFEISEPEEFNEPEISDEMFEDEPPEEEAYDTYDYESDTREESVPDENGDQIGTRDIENMYRLENSLKSYNEKYMFFPGEDGDIKIISANLPLRYNVTINHHGVILPSESPDDQFKEEFEKMVRDVRSAVIEELEIESKEEYYASQTLAGRSTTDYLSDLVSEYLNQKKAGEEAELSYNYKDRDGHDFLSVSIKDRHESPVIAYRFAEEYGGAEVEIPFETETDNLMESKANEKFIELLENTALLNELDQVKYEFKNKDTVLERSDKIQRERIKVGNDATLGKHIDATIANISSAVRCNVLPVVKNAEKTLSTANSIRRGIIRGYKDGILSGFEILPGIKDLKEGWRGEWNISTLKNSLTGTALVELKTAKEDWLIQNGAVPGEEEKYKEQLLEVEKEYFKKKIPDLYGEFEAGKSLNKAVMDLEKKYYELNRSENTEDKLKASKVRQEIYFARNCIYRDMEEFRRYGLKVKLQADRAVDELCKLKRAIREKRVERRDLNRAGRAVAKFREELAHLGKMLKEKTRNISAQHLRPYKEFLINNAVSVKERVQTLKRDEKIINCDVIKERNMAELINDSFIKIPMTERAFIATFSGKNFYEELEYKEAAYKREMDNVRDEDLNDIALMKKKNYEEAIEQKETVDKIAKGVIKIKEEILEMDIKKEEAVEMIATGIRNTEAALNAMNNIDNTDIFTKLDENEKNSYREVAESVIKNDAELSGKEWSRTISIDNRDKAEER